MQITIRLIYYCFKAQSYVKAFNGSFNIIFEILPIVFLADNLFYFIDIEITY